MKKAEKISLDLRRSWIKREKKNNFKMKRRKKKTLLMKVVTLVKQEHQPENQSLELKRKKMRTLSSDF